MCILHYIHVYICIYIYIYILKAVHSHWDHQSSPAPQASPKESWVLCLTSDIRTSLYPHPDPHLCMHDLTPHRPQISMPGCPWCSDTCLAILGLWYPIPGHPSRETASSPYLGFDKPYWLAPRNGCPHPAEALTAPLLSALNALSRTSCLHSGGPLHPEATPLWECPPCPAQDLVVTSRLPIWVLSLHTKSPLHISAPRSAWTVSSSFPGCCAPPPWGRPPHPAWT